MRTSLVVVALLCVVAPVPAFAGDGSGALSSFGYGRLGYGGVFVDRFQPTPSMGFGYRAELKTLAVDVSFLNMQLNANGSGTSNGAFAMSWLKLEALRYTNPDGSRSAYFGGGMSMGFMYAERGGAQRYGSTTIYRPGWGGGGLQGELTAGYELPRTSAIRMFVQADVGLPLYKVSSESYEYTVSGGRLVGTNAIERRYAPTAVVSVGIGWDRHHRHRK